MKALALLLICMLFLAGCGPSIKSPEECKPGECNIIKTCKYHKDCIVNCGCDCVAKSSDCPEETREGVCPVGGLACMCVEGKCTYSIPPPV